MSVSTIVSRFGTFTITANETSVYITDHLGAELANLIIPEEAVAEITHDRPIQAYRAAVEIVNTKIKDLADEALYYATKNPAQPPLSSFQRASLVNSLKSSGQIENIVKEMANPTSVPGLPLPPDVRKF